MNHERRTRSQVLEARKHAARGGCCERFADQMGCDCLAQAIDDRPNLYQDVVMPLNHQAEVMQLAHDFMAAHEAKLLTKEAWQAAIQSGENSQLAYLADDRANEALDLARERLFSSLKAAR